MEEELHRILKIYMDNCINSDMAIKMIMELFEEPEPDTCDVEGCKLYVSCGGTTWREYGYWSVCILHSQEFRQGKPFPQMKLEAIEREKRRDKKGIIRNNI